MVNNGFIRHKIITWTLISQCLSMQFKECLESERVNLGNNIFDGKLKLICSWLWIVRKHALEMEKDQDTIFRDVLCSSLCSPQCLSVAFSHQRKTFTVASI